MTIRTPACAWRRCSATRSCSPARARAPEREGPPRPEIRLGPAGQAHETGEGIYHLQATIRDPVEVRDAWVRISNLQARLDGKKVTFSAGPDAGPRDRLELSTDVPLSPGLNEIGVCARGKEAERCETTFVFRLPASLK